MPTQVIIRNENIKQSILELKKLINRHKIKKIVKAKQFFMTRGEKNREKARRKVATIRKNTRKGSYNRRRS